MKSIYLGGHVNEKISATLQWRVDAERLLRGNFDVVSPVREGQRSPREIFLACHAAVARAELMLVMLDTFGSPHPMCGTYFEMAWAWERHLPIIAVAEQEGLIMGKKLDPFIVSTTTVWKPSLITATDHLIACWS